MPRTWLSTDSFNRSDSTDIGSAWTSNGSGCQIVSNVVRSNSAIGSGGCAFWNQTFPNDQWAQFTIVTNTTAGGQFHQFMIGLRMGGASFDGFWFYVDNFNAIIAKYVSGFTTLASVANTIAVNDVYRAEAQGTSLTFYKNDTLLTSVTDSSFTSGSPAINLFINSGAPNAVGDAEIDNWEAGSWSKMAMFRSQA